MLDDTQRGVLDVLNIDNIRRLEQETGFFSHKSHEQARDLEMFRAFARWLNIYNSSISTFGVDFKYGSLPYKEFLNQFANSLNLMRKVDIFALSDFSSDDWIQGEFRTNYPEIFMDINAPEELRNAFYKNRLTPQFLHEHKEYIPYLINKNLSFAIKTDIRLNIIKKQSYINTKNREKLYFIGNKWVKLNLMLTKKHKK